jgi:cutinase
MYTQTILVSILAGLATASPIEVRQLIGGTGATSSEFSRGGCKEILFAWARGSTEIGNMVRLPHSFHPYLSDTPREQS